MEVRLIEKDYPGNPHMNLAMDEAIFREVEQGRSPPTLRFYRNRNAAILGCFQLADEELDLEYAKSNRIKIAKRFTGGGAVYHDMGNLNYSVISRDNYGIGLNVERLFSVMMKGATSSLRLANIPNLASGMNDITSGGRKIMGAAATISKGTVLFHAALLVETKLETLASVLKVPGIKLRDKGVSTILERVANIREICGADVDHVRRSIQDGYSLELGFDYKGGELTEGERLAMGKLYKEKYSKRDWNMGREFIEVSV